MAASNSSLRSIMVTLLLFGFVLSPILPTSDARFTVVQELIARSPICPACVCSAPPPPTPRGSCCPCASSSVIESHSGLP